MARNVAVVVAVAWLAVLAAGCASTGAGHVYKLYPGEVRSTDQVAIIQMDVAGASVGGMPVRSADWAEIHVLPGRHLVRWSNEFGASVMVVPSGSIGAVARAEVDLEAGHVYALRGARGGGAKIYLWIHDTTSGRVVAGQEKP
jgi:hypothetical protein